MSNVHRLRNSERIFFITANLSKNSSHLTEAEFAGLLHIFDSTRRRLGFLLCGYVLMPEHWHALIFPRYPLTISRVLQDVKSISGRRFNPRRGRKGALWQHQFWDRFVRHGQEFRDRLEYMHRNPVTAGLVKRAEDWRWSSCNNFALDHSVVANCPMQIDYVELPDSYRA